MARVLALCADLMFGSRIAAQLQAAGEQLELLADAGAVRARLQGPAQERPRVLVVDLTSGSEEGIELRLARGRAVSAASGPGHGGAAHARLLLPRGGGRARARRGAGFDLVVPRSRMAREGAALVERLLAESTPPAG